MPASEGQEVQELYEFGPFRVDADREILLRDGEFVPLTPKTFQILLVLVRRRQEVVTKDDLMKAVWPDTFVEEANLSRNIFMLRKALGETPQDHRYIVTVPGRGYRLAESVRRVADQDLALVSAAPSELVAATHSEVEIEVNETRPWAWVVVGAVVVLAIALGLWRFLLHRTPLLTERDTVVLADFSNSTGDPVFDETLRQGMKVQLEQSPFLSLVSDSRIQQTLRLMGRHPDARLTPDVAREICERTGSTAVVSGSIATLGSRFVLGLEAKTCGSGEMLDAEQAEVAKKEDVLSALSQVAARFRTKVGESLASVEKYSKPLEQATTTSLDALKAYSTGVRVSFIDGFGAGIPFLEKAIAIDPQFALAYAHLGLWYSAMGESARGLETTSTAYQLRERASDKERYFITAMYHREVTGNLEASYQTLNSWTETYPRDQYGHALISGFSSQGTGRYEESIAHAQRAIKIDPGFTPAYVNVAFSQFYLDRIGEAKAALRRATERNLETPEILLLRYHLAMLDGDEAEMQRVTERAKDKPGAGDWMLYSQALVLARSGRLRAAREMSERAVDLARQGHENERAATYIAGVAAWEALFGNADAARREALAALDSSKGRDIEFAAAFALGLAGESARCSAAADDLEKRFPEDTSVRSNYLPALRGLLALRGGSPKKALEALQPAVAYESVVDALDFNTFFGGLYPTYVRGEAHMAAHKYPEAAAEFQKILDHQGLLASDPVAAVALLESARAYARAGDAAKAKAAYEGLFAIWRNADAESRTLREAKAEYDGLR